MCDHEFFAKVKKLYINPKYIKELLLRGKSPLVSRCHLWFCGFSFFEKARQPFCDFFSKDLYYCGLFMDKLASQGENTTKVRARYSLRNSKFKKASLNNESLFNF